MCIQKSKLNSKETQKKSYTTNNSKSIEELSLQYKIKSWRLIVLSITIIIVKIHLLITDQIYLIWINIATLVLAFAIFILAICFLCIKKSFIQKLKDNSNLGIIIEFIQFAMVIVLLGTNMIVFNQDYNSTYNVDNLDHETQEYHKIVCSDKFSKYFFGFYITISLLK